MNSDTPQTDPSLKKVKKRAPTLYAIIVIKLGKGLLLLLLALGVWSLSDNNLPEEFRTMLRFFHFDPENRFFTDMATSLSRITPTNVEWVAWGTGAYSTFSLVEGVGLIFRVGWAGWMAIGESLFFIPIEVYKLAHKVTPTVTIVFILNIIIAWYLFQNRRRLFRHHIPRRHRALHPSAGG